KALTTAAVANGILYIGSDDANLYAFDAAGITNCSGSNPRTCNPLWTGATGDMIDASPAIANGVVYVGSRDKKLYAFDAAGITNCSSTPKTCSPLWTATTGGQIFSSPPVADGVVYVMPSGGPLYAF